MLFSFVGAGEYSVCPGTVLDYVPMGWVGESRMVHDAFLFVLQIHISSFETSWQGEMTWHTEASHGLAVQDVAAFNSD
jgi:hypothetical protein